MTKNKFKNGDHKRDFANEDTSNIYLDTIHVPINEILYDSRSLDLVDRKNLEEVEKIDHYPWKDLYDDILKNGLKVLPRIAEITFQYKSYDWHSNYKYHVLDGNHRLRILGYIHGEDVRVGVDLYLSTSNIQETLGYAVEPLDVKERLAELKKKIYSDEG